MQETGRAGSCRDYVSFIVHFSKLHEERELTSRRGDAWDVAHAALFLASDEARYITGQEIIVDGGLVDSTG